MRILRPALVTAISIALVALKSESKSDEQALIDIEYAWGQAMIDRDYSKVDQILDEEWSGIDPHGKPIDKARFMRDLRAGQTATTALEYGPIKVKIYDGFALVTGSNKETATFQGKNSTGEYAWIDVHIKRKDGWRILSSQYTKLH